MILITIINLGLHSHNYINIIWCCSTEFQSFSFKSYSLKHSTTPFLSFLYTKGRTYTHQNILVAIVLKKSTDHSRETVLFFRQACLLKFALLLSKIIYQKNLYNSPLFSYPSLTLLISSSTPLIVSPVSGSTLLAYCGRKPFW